jgi:hypothetical protein
MIRKRQAHNVSGRDMQPQSAFVAGLFQIAACTRGREHFVRPAFSARV